jgi:hypothetical protein
MLAHAAPIQALLSNHLRLVALEILHFTFMLLCGTSGLERAEVTASLSLGIDFSRI